MHGDRNCNSASHSNYVPWAKTSRIAQKATGEFPRWEIGRDAQEKTSHDETAPENLGEKPPKAFARRLSSTNFWATNRCVHLKISISFLVNFSLQICNDKSLRRAIIKICWLYKIFTFDFITFSISQFRSISILLIRLMLN